MSYDTSGYRAYDSDFGTIIYAPNGLRQDELNAVTRPLNEREAKQIQDTAAAFIAAIKENE